MRTLCYDPFWEFNLLRKSLRKTFHTKKKLSEMGLDPGPKLAKFIFSNSLLHKNLDKKFGKKIFTHEGEKGVNFLMKTDSKHQ